MERSSLAYFMHKIIQLSFILITALLSFQLSAEESATAGDTLEIDFADVSQRAWTNAREILASESQLLKSEAISKNDRSFLLPQVNFQASYQQQDEGDPLLGQFSLEERSSAQISVEQFIFGFGQRSGSKIQSDARLSAASAQHLVNKYQTLHSIRLSLIDVWLQMANVEVNQKRLEQREQELRDVEARLAAGAAAGIDKRLAEINALSSKNQLLEAQAAEAMARLHLKQRLRLPEKQTLRIKREWEKLPNFDVILKHAEMLNEDNQQTQVFDAQYNQSTAQITRLDGQQLPQLFAGASYAGVGETFDDLSEQWQIGISLRWSLYDGGSRYSQKAAFEAESNAIQQQRTLYTEQRRRLLRQIQVQIKQLLTRLKQQETIISLAGKNYEDTRSLYQAGSTTLTRLGESSVQLDEAKFLRNTIINNLHKVGVQLMELAELAPKSGPAPTID